MAIEFGSRKETFENFKVYETTLAGRPFKVEMGKMCGLSNASALIRYGETCVLCNVVNLTVKNKNVKEKITNESERKNVKRTSVQSVVRWA